MRQLPDFPTGCDFWLATAAMFFLCVGQATGRAQALSLCETTYNIFEKSILAPSSSEIQCWDGIEEQAAEVAERTRSHVYGCIVIAEGLTAY